MKSINICWFSAYSPSMIQTCPELGYTASDTHQIIDGMKSTKNKPQYVGGVPYIWIRPLYRFIKPLLIFGSLISSHDALRSKTQREPGPLWRSFHDRDICALQNVVFQTGYFVCNQMLYMLNYVNNAWYIYVYTNVFIYLFIYANHTS